MSDFEDTTYLKDNSEELIKNIELNNLIKFKLNKDNFTNKDLESIDEIVLDSKNIIGNYNKVYFEELDLFKKLKKISVRNLGITDKNMSRLTNISQVEFVNCEIPDFENIKNAQVLKIINTKVEKFDTIIELTNLKELHLINIELDDFEFLKTYKNLEKLVIKNVNGFSLSKIDFYLPIEYLSIEKITNIDLNVILKFKNLKILSVDRIEAEGFKEDLNFLSGRGIKILLNDQYEY